MKILQVANRFFPYIGGTENYVYNLSKELVKLGHKVTVICANEPKLKSETIEGINVIRVNYLFKIANTNITPFLALDILRQDFDIMHNYLPHPWSVDWASLIGRIKKKPMILTYNNDIPEKGKYKVLTWIYNRIFLKFILKVSKVIIITQSNYINFSKFLIKFKSKIKIIPCGVDIEKIHSLNLQKKDNIKRIFFLSVLDEYHRYKGLDYLLKSFVNVLKEINDVVLVIGGEGALRKEYEKMAEDFGISKYVNFVGRIPRTEINRYFNECDVFVLPSISSEQEGFGIVALEAMACGKPVIATNIVGTSSQIERHQAGIVITPRNEEELRRALVKILENEKLMLEMGSAGLKLVEQNYSWQKVAKQILNIYNSLL